MIQSMTGFAAGELDTPRGRIMIELRAVNHRYLELQLKIDDHLRVFEPSIRELLQTKLGRGKVDCRINMMRDTSLELAGQINHAAIQQIAENAKMAAQYFPHVQAVNLLELLKMPGVMATEAFDIAAIEAPLKQRLEQIITQLIDAKSREGQKLAVIILARLQDIELQVAKVLPMMPNLMAQYQQKLVHKLNEATNSHDDERIRQEMVLFAQRIDVDEELSRLGAHISEVKHILNTGGLVGKRLDFLMQEMNREANTLGSKSVAVETSQISMNLKVLIEQMREQIQNIE